MLISSLIRLVGTAMQSPAIDAGSDVIKYAIQLASFAQTGKLTIEELKAQSDFLSSMIEENRAPTPEEFASLKSLSDSLSSRIQNG